MIKNHNVRHEEIQYFQKAITQRLRQDKRKHILNTLRKELDVREKWAGIRALKSNFNPMPYNRKDKQGNIVAQESRAETAAQHLAYDQWGTLNTELNNQPNNLNSSTSQLPLNIEAPKFKTTHIIPPNHPSRVIQDP